uniref:acylneuraminate cytidylyltransferase family protein n=1 Tax=Flavobacterium sp. TaxID=239 RepID=UPI00404B303B
MTKSKYKVIGLVPARSGSKRIKNKNIKYLNGHPLIAYTIQSALNCGLFSKVVCVTDCPEITKIALYYGAEVPVLRPNSTATDLSPDIDWVIWILNYYISIGERFDIFSILRPTSPFRLSSTIETAFKSFLAKSHIDSLRAVQKVREHPGKMWVINEKQMFPLLPFKLNQVPWHSSQYANLPEIYIQNASLEIAYTKTVFELNSISGNVIQPFISSGLEGFDINNPEDWTLAEHYINSGEGKLTNIQLKPFNKV